jgi:hypothetical protein
MKRFLLTSTYPFSDCVIAWHTYGMMVDIPGTVKQNVYIRVWYKSPVAKKHMVTAKRRLIGIATLILVSSFFILDPINWYIDIVIVIDIDIDIDVIYLTAMWLTPSGSSTAHIYTQIIHMILKTEHT